MYGEDLDPPAAMDTYLMFIPRGTMVDGAVVELAQLDRRAIAADVRIPAAP